MNWRCNLWKVRLYLQLQSDAALFLHFSFQALCRVKLLLDQMTRMEPDSKALARSTATLPKQSHTNAVSNGRFAGQAVASQPVIRAQRQPSTISFSGSATQEKTLFESRCLALALNLVRKETIRLQRIPPNTIWDPARVDTIDTLSGFYVQNFDPDVRDRFSLMLQELP